MKLSTAILALVLAGFSNAEELIQCITCKTFSGVIREKEIHLCGYSGRLMANNEVCEELREKVHVHCTNIPECGQYFSMNAEPDQNTKTMLKKCEHQNSIILTPYSSTSHSEPLLNLLV
ncbi:hypothetical protein PGTUg99_004501 [Puccinia graminis f. sp. tritici]|uniref:Uncharacterized protein n=2 Tax=Puccinia graminis f. sp. tritici TaxID=56615 RepID=E3JV77_PUCGT|nr:uncharacterized protein PGTG_01283 [Puccinia graminis f. sp. tritici CRL 75-36-700-3]EFP75952.2 hypothetical protein PGTG_01283 [Puccinia graminis f. sp. tritici CRL 75-36-700-3]KAA1137393.1 hypothetical protein PGTUg99_004501 [Puccinia graminis f. sp. tritici]